jgi:sRNA-binding protein
MKALTLFTVCLASVSLADDFKTIDGQEYKDATVTRVEPDGLVLTTGSGISKVYFTELPQDVKERFHYDAAKAVAYVSEQKAELERVRKQQEEARKRAEETEKHWKEQAGTKAQQPAETEQQPDTAGQRRQTPVRGHSETITSRSKEGAIEPLYQLTRDHTIQIRFGPNGASIRLKRGERYPGRILGDHGEIDINGISYWVPSGLLVPVKD